MEISSLLKRRRSTYGGALKTISSLLIAAFLLQDLALANPDLKPIAWDKAEDHKPWARKFLPEIPKSVAVLEDAWRAEGSDPSGTKTLILLQDAHTNASGQINLAKTLDILLSFRARHFAGEKSPTGIRYVFLEAGQGDESLAFLRSHAPLEKRKQIGASYRQKGELQGSEYLNLTSDHDFVLWGVEDMGLYAKALATYRQVAKERGKFEDYLDRVEKTVKVLKPRIYNPLLLEFDEKYQKYRKNKVPLTEYSEILSEEAARLEVPLSSFPHLKTFRKLQALEKRINFDRAGEEQVKAVASLSEADRKELFEIQNPSKVGSDNKIQTAYFAQLHDVIARSAATKQSMRKDRHGRHGDLAMTQMYPELSKYFRYLKASQKIDLKKILEEQKALEEKIFSALTTNEDERQLLQASRNVQSLKKLLYLQFTPDDFKAYLENKKSFDITRITGFLNRKIMDLRQFYEGVTFLEEGYEATIQKCEAFYELTTQRDQKFVENVTKKMGNETAILITGGYHAPNLKHLLQKENISYIVLTPQILRETNQKRYEKLLLSQNLMASPMRTSPSAQTLMIQRIASNALGNREAFTRDIAGKGWDKMRRAELRLTGARLAEEQPSNPGRDLLFREAFRELSPEDWTFLGIVPGEVVFYEKQRTNEPNRRHGYERFVYRHSVTMQDAQGKRGKRVFFTKQYRLIHGGWLARMTAWANAPLRDWRFKREFVRIVHAHERNSAPAARLVTLKKEKTLLLKPAIGREFNPQVMAYLSEQEREKFGFAIGKALAVLHREVKMVHGDLTKDGELQSKNIFWAENPLTHELSVEFIDFHALKPRNFWFGGYENERRSIRAARAVGEIKSAFDLGYAFDSRIRIFGHLPYGEAGRILATAVEDMKVYDQRNKDKLNETLIALKYDPNPDGDVLAAAVAPRRFGAGAPKAAELSHDMLIRLAGIGKGVSYRKIIIYFDAKAQLPVKVATGAWPPDKSHSHHFRTRFLKSAKLVLSILQESKRYPKEVIEKVSIGVPPGLFDPSELAKIPRGKDVDYFQLSEVAKLSFIAAAPETPSGARLATANRLVEFQDRPDTEPFNREPFPFPEPGKLLPYESQLLHVTLKVQQIDVVMRAFQRDVLSFDSRGMLVLNVPGKKEYEEVVAAMRRYVANLSITMLKEMRDAGWITASEHDENTKNLRDPSRAQENASLIMRKIIPEYFARHGLYFEAGFVPYQGILLPFFEVRPVAEIKKQKARLKAVGDTEVEFTLIRLDPSRVRTLYEHDKRLPRQASSHMKRFSDQVFVREDLIRDNSENVLKGYRERLANARRRNPDLKEGALLTFGEEPNLKKRVETNLFLQACYSIGARSEKPDAENLAILNEFHLQDMLAHEPFHVWQEKTRPIVMVAKRDAPFLELESDVAQALGSKDSRSVAAYALMAPRMTAVHMGDHAKGYLYLTNRLAFHLWKDKALLKKTGVPVPALEGKTEESVLQFSDLPEEARGVVWEALGRLSKDDLHTLYLKVFLELQSSDNPYFKGLDLKAVSLSDAFLMRKEKEGLSRWVLPSATAVVGVAAGAGLFWIIQRRARLAKEKKGQSGARLAKRAPESPLLSFLSAAGLSLQAADALRGFQSPRKGQQPRLPKAFQWRGDKQDKQFLGVFRAFMDAIAQSPLKHNEQVVLFASLCAAKLLVYEGRLKRQMETAVQKWVAAVPKELLYKESPGAVRGTENAPKRSGRRGGFSENVASYLKEISAFPQLTQIGEIILGLDMRTGDAEARQRARKEFIQANLRLVISIAKKFIWSGLPTEELINAGNEGLIHAVDKWEPSYGYRFSTYVFRSIKRSVQRAIMVARQKVSISIGRQEKFGLFVKACRGGAVDPYDERLSNEEIADKIGWSEKDVASIRKVGQTRVISLDTPVSEGEEGTLEDFIARPDEGLARLTRELSREEVKKFLNELKASMFRSGLWTGPGMVKRDFRIFEAYYFRDPQPRYTVLGREFGISHEAVRLILLKVRKQAALLARRGDLKWALDPPESEGKTSGARLAKSPSHADVIDGGAWLLVAAILLKSDTLAKRRYNQVLEKYDVSHLAASLFVLASAAGKHTAFQDIHTRYHYYLNKGHTDEIAALLTTASVFLKDKSLCVAEYYHERLTTRNKHKFVAALLTLATAFETYQSWGVADGLYRRFLNNRHTADPAVAASLAIPAARRGARVESIKALYGQYDKRRHPSFVSALLVFAHLLSSAKDMETVEKRYEGFMDHMQFGSFGARLALSEGDLQVLRDTTTIHERIRYLRHLRKLSQSALAEKARTGHSSVYAWEKDRKVIEPSSLVSLAEALEVEPSLIYAGRPLVEALQHAPSFGRRLRILRYSVGQTEEQIEAAIKIGDSTISRWEQEVHIPRYIEDIEKLAAYFAKYYPVVKPPLLFLGWTEPDPEKSSGARLAGTGHSTAPPDVRKPEGSRLAEEQTTKEESDKLLGLIQHVTGRPAWVNRVARVVATGAVHRGTSLPHLDPKDPNQDYDFAILFKPGEEYAEYANHLRDDIGWILQDSGYWVHHVNRSKSRAGMLFMFFVRDTKGRFFKVDVTLGFDQKLYPEYFEDQMREIASRGGDVTMVKRDIILMKKLARDVLGIYKRTPGFGEHGRLNGVAAEQLVIQSGGTFNKAMGWICAIGFDHDTKEIIPIGQVLKSHKFYEPEGDRNILGHVFSELTWRKMAGAAKKYVDLGKQEITEEELPLLAVSDDEVKPAAKAEQAPKKPASPMTAPEANSPKPLKGSGGSIFTGPLRTSDGRTAYRTKRDFALIGFLMTSPHNRFLKAGELATWRVRVRDLKRTLIYADKKVMHYDEMDVSIRLNQNTFRKAERVQQVVINKDGELTFVHWDPDKGSLVRKKIFPDQKNDVLVTDDSLYQEAERAAVFLSKAREKGNMRVEVIDSRESKTVLMEDTHLFKTILFDGHVVLRTERRRSPTGPFEPPQLIVYRGVMEDGKFKFFNPEGRWVEVDENGNVELGELPSGARLAERKKTRERHDRVAAMLNKKPDSGKAWTISSLAAKLGMKYHTVYDSLNARDLLDSKRLGREERDLISAEKLEARRDRVMKTLLQAQPPTGKRWTIPALAKALRLPREMVYRDLKAKKLLGSKRLHRRDMPTETVLEARRVRLVKKLNEWNLARLARDLGLAPDTVYSDLKRMDLLGRVGMRTVHRTPAAEVESRRRRVKKMFYTRPPAGKKWTAKALADRLDLPLKTVFDDLRKSNLLDSRRLQRHHGQQGARLALLPGKPDYTEIAQKLSLYHGRFKAGKGRLDDLSPTERESET
ncbi:MAG: sigma-70 family RNA polymerase sigma factor, partial [Candidatus Omnitrophota bacterium]